MISENSRPLEPGTIMKSKVRPPKSPPSVAEPMHSARDGTAKLLTPTEYVPVPDRRMTGPVDVRVSCARRPPTPSNVIKPTAEATGPLQNLPVVLVTRLAGPSCHPYL